MIQRHRGPHPESTIGNDDDPPKMTQQVTLSMLPHQPQNHELATDALVQFCLLHISDLHFSIQERARDPRAAIRALFRGQPLEHLRLFSGHDPEIVESIAHFAYHNRAGFDSIVISGDLATTGSPDDLNSVSKFIRHPPSVAYHDSTGSPTLTAPAKQIVLLPGNHDRYYPWSGNPGNPNFDHWFQDHWWVRQGSQRMGNILSRGGASLILVGADLTLQRNDDGDLFFIGRFGRGRVTERVIAQLVSETQLARKDYPTSAVIWVLHFEPSAEDLTLRLCDSHGLLADAVRQSQPTAILCGHTHLPSRQVDFAGVPVFICGTTSQCYAPHGNFLQAIYVRVDPAQRIAPQVSFQPFAYDHRHGFFPTDERQL